MVAVTPLGEPSAGSGGPPDASTHGWPIHCSLRGDCPGSPQSLAGGWALKVGVNHLPSLPLFLFTINSKKPWTLLATQGFRLQLCWAMEAELSLDLLP